MLPSPKADVCIIVLTLLLCINNLQAQKLKHQINTGVEIADSERQPSWQIHERYLTSVSGRLTKKNVPDLRRFFSVLRPKLAPTKTGGFRTIFISKPSTIRPKPSRTSVGAARGRFFSALRPELAPTGAATKTGGFRTVPTGKPSAARPHRPTENGAPTPGGRELPQCDRTPRQSRRA